MDCLVTTLKADTQNNNLPFFEKLEIAVNNVGSVSNFLFQSSDYSEKISLYDGNGDKTGEISSKTTAQTIDFTGVTKMVVENKYKINKLHLKNAGFSFDLAGLFKSNVAVLDISGSSVFGNIEKLQQCTNLRGLDCWNVSGIYGDMGKLAALPDLGVYDFLNVKINNTLYDLRDYANYAVINGNTSSLLKSNAYGIHWSNMLKLNGTTCTSSNFNSFGWEKVSGEDRIKIAYYQGSQTGASGASKIFHYGYTTAEIEALSAGAWSGKTLVDCN